jgi:hypothetical protein
LLPRPRACSSPDSLQVGRGRPPDPSSGLARGNPSARSWGVSPNSPARDGRSCPAPLDAPCAAGAQRISPIPPPRWRLGRRTSKPAAPKVATPATPPPCMARLWARTSRAGGVSSAKAVARTGHRWPRSRAGPMARSQSLGPLVSVVARGAGSSQTSSASAANATAGYTRAVVKASE